MKEKEQKRILHNTSDHDYVETPVKETEKSPAKPEAKTTPKKVETDVFEFDELNDDDLKESKMSYLKSNAQRLALKKEAEASIHKKNEGATSPTKTTEPKSYLRESEKGSAVKETKNDDDIPLRDLAKKDLSFEEIGDESKKEPELKSPKSSPVKDPESRRNSRSSTDGLEKKEIEIEVKDTSKRKVSTSDDEKQKPKEVVGEKEAEVEVVVEAETVKEEKIEVEDVEERRKSADIGEQSEEEKQEEQEENEVMKDDDVSHLIDAVSLNSNFIG